jgi:hypothetical protein
MADAWGGSWGASWGRSWGYSPDSGGSVGESSVSSFLVARGDWRNNRNRGRKWLWGHCARCGQEVAKTSLVRVGNEKVCTTCLLLS